MTEPERPGPWITEADVSRLRAAAVEVVGQHTRLTPYDAVRQRCSCGWQWSAGTDHTTHLAEALVGEDVATDLIDAIQGLVARVGQAVLDRACERIAADCAHGDFRMGTWPQQTCPFCQPKVASVRALAAELRGG